MGRTHVGTGVGEQIEVEARRMAHAGVDHGAEPRN
eukprot:COSAG01_NODE_20764_length_936_cov_11.475508_1_plen_34_part_10